MSSLEGKVVLITGGSSGIGRATAFRLAKMGAKLILLARGADGLESARREVEVQPDSVLCVQADVVDADQVRSSVEAGVARFGRLDAVIASAGLSMRAMFESCTLDAIEKIFRVNFFGVVNVTHFALPAIIRSKGSLVAISSVTGNRGVPSYSVYGASKFAVRGLYEALRVEMRRHGVHVGIVSPAFVDTPLRGNVMGPTGEPWPTPPEPPFRVWPVDTIAEKVVHLLLKRKRHAVIPAFVPPLMAFDDLLGNFLGDRILANRFPIEKNDPPKV